MDLSAFNPHALTEDDFVASFVARQTTLDHLLQQLRLVQPDQPARHHLIVAPRGYGKTTLLRRVAIAVRQEPDLRSGFIPLSFREEQHNVISLDIFWRNCLQSLQEAREDEGADAAELQTLEADWERHAPRQALPREQQDGEPAWLTLAAHAERLGRRPLLLIDNLDTLLAGLSATHQWALRRRLQGDDGPVLLAAAPRYPDATHDPNAAFFEFFRIHTLDRLEDTEVFTCLRHLAQRRGNAGQPVLQLLAQDPGRISALNTLAGGNPRTLGVLYRVLESHMSADLLSQLNAMLDTFTGWYQARTEELPMQARAVFDALALHWDPMTAAALGLASGLDTPSVSSQLSRLERAGYIETVSLSRLGKGRKAYQLSERFFNIWYLMRNGPRRAKQSIRFLTVFLQACFSGHERRALARALLGKASAEPSYLLAMATTLGDSGLREEILERASTRARETGLTDEFGPLIGELRLSRGRGKRRDHAKVSAAAFDLDAQVAALDIAIASHLASSDAQAASLVARLMFFKGTVLVAGAGLERGAMVYDEIFARFGSAVEPALRDWVARAMLAKGKVVGRLGNSAQEIEIYADIVARFGSDTDPGIRHQVVAAQFIRGKTLFDRHADFPGARQAYEAGLRVAQTDGQRRVLHANLAYLLALGMGELAAAHEQAQLALGSTTWPSASGRCLLEALPIWPGVDWPRTFNRIGAAVDSNDPELWSTFQDDLERLLGHLIAHGQGPAFQAWMAQTDWATRVAPLYHAVIAAIDGEDHLLTINPETRQPAAAIYAGIARRVKIFSADRQGKSAKRR